MKKIFWISSLFLLVIIFSNSDIAQTWEKLNPNFLEKDTLLEYAALNFATKNVGWISTYGYFNTGGYRSILLETKDGGISWKLKWELKKSILADKSFNLYSNNSSGDGVIATFKLDTNNIWFMGSGGNGGLLFSQDMGLTWDTSRITSENTNSVSNNFCEFHFFNYKKGIAFNDFGWFTSDGGYTWTKGEDTISNFMRPTDVYFLNDSIGWIVSNLSDVFDVGSISKTTNGGITWSFQHKRAHLMTGVAFIDSLRGFAVGTNRQLYNGYIYQTINAGENWEVHRYDYYNPFYTIRFFDNLYGWIGGTGKILRTTNGGENWEIQVNGMQTNFEQIIILNKDKVAYALGKDWTGKTHTLLRADLSNLTAVKNDRKFLPEGYKLFQNYPNPFNPSTTISYQIPSNSVVTLKVYDILGNEVSVLVNEWKEPGSYNAQFTTSSAVGGKQLASGMYFYTLTAGKFMVTKKFILMK
ncbi:MAG: T9SS type A sorting domain-containing protein [Ignavibacteriaceae bacterium]|jgi:photosystem II stability/assembly factor-like uncharacterized protein